MGKNQEQLFKELFSGELNGNSSKINKELKGGIEGALNDTGMY